MVEPTLHNLLTASAQVMDLAPGGIAHNASPQGERRARVVLQLTSSPRDHLLDPGNQAAGYQRGRIEARVYAPTYRAAKELAQAIESTINDRTNTNALGLWVMDTRDIPQQPADGQPSPVFGVAVELGFIHNPNT